MPHFIFFFFFTIQLAFSFATFSLLLAAVTTSIPLVRHHATPTVGGCQQRCIITGTTAQHHAARLRFHALSIDILLRRCLRLPFDALRFAAIIAADYFRRHHFFHRCFAAISLLPRHYFFFRRH